MQGETRQGGKKVERKRKREEGKKEKKEAERKRKIRSLFPLATF